MAAKPKETKTSKASSSVARLGDGTIQITFTIPAEEVKTAWDESLQHVGANVEIAGFRKGKAPLDQVLAKVGESKIVEHSLQHLLPQLTAKVVNEEKLKIAIYPRFELLSVKPGEDWQIRAITCELPEVDLGEYKKAIKASAPKARIWTPGSTPASGEQDKLSSEETEAGAIRALLENVKITIPQILIDEEVNDKLARLLARLEKLGISLENYLASNGKKGEDLREDYVLQAKQSITLDLALSEIAKQEGLTIAQKDVDSAIAAQESVSKETELSESSKANRQSLIRATLMKRAALDFVVSLA